METKHDWNGSMQHLVQRNGCDSALRAVKGYKEQTAPATVKTEEETDTSVSLPWIKRFATEAGVNPQAASTIISQLNNYHRITSITSKAKNKVTPPSRSLNPPWVEQGQLKSSTEPSTRKHPGDPPPLLLAGSNAALASTVGIASINSPTGTKQVLSVPTKKGVPHVYHDYSNVPDVVGVVRKKTGGVTQPFPEKLHTMLDNDDDPTIVSWLPHGRAFLVRKPAEFTAQIMPK